MTQENNTSIHILDILFLTGCPRCPESREADDIYNVGRGQIAACHTHKTKWEAGYGWPMLRTGPGDPINDTLMDQAERYREIEDYYRVKETFPTNLQTSEEIADLQSAEWKPNKCEADKPMRDPAAEPGDDAAAF